MSRSAVAVVVAAGSFYLMDAVLELPFPVTLIVGLVIGMWLGLRHRRADEDDARRNKEE